MTVALLLPRLSKGGLGDERGSACGQSARPWRCRRDSLGWSSLASPIPTRSTQTKHPRAREQPVQSARGGLGTAPQHGSGLVLCWPSSGSAGEAPLPCSKRSLFSGRTRSCFLETEIRLPGPELLYAFIRTGAEKVAWLNSALNFGVSFISVLLENESKGK